MVAADEEEEESEDAAFIEEATAPAYTSPELRPALPSKHNDEMPDKV